MKEEMTKALIWMFGKIFSARFLTLVILVTTFSYINIKMIDAFLSFVKASQDLPPGMKEIFLIIMGAYISTINTVIAFYFLRSDRKQ